MAPLTCLFQPKSNSSIECIDFRTVQISYFIGVPVLILLLIMITALSATVCCLRTKSIAKKKISAKQCTDEERAIAGGCDLTNNTSHKPEGRRKEEEDMSRKELSKGHEQENGNAIYDTLLSKHEPLLDGYSTIEDTFATDTSTTNNFTDKDDSTSLYATVDELPLKITGMNKPDSILTEVNTKRPVEEKIIDGKQTPLYSVVNLDQKLKTEVEPISSLETKSALLQDEHTLSDNATDKKEDKTERHGEEIIDGGKQIPLYSVVNLDQQKIDESKLNIPEAKSALVQDKCTLSHNAVDVMQNELELSSARTPPPLPPPFSMN